MPEATPHQETDVLSSQLPKNKPKAAGLKICLFLILKKCLENIAKATIKNRLNIELLGELSKPIIRPLTKAAEGKKDWILLILWKR